MKKILFIFMLISISCIANCRNVNITLADKKENAIETQKIDSLIGNWVISKTIWTETTYENGGTVKTESAIVCNVCPTVILKKNGEGISINAVGDESSFNWQVDKDNIIFSFNKKSDEDSFFSLDKIFNFKIYNDSKNSYIELSEYSKKYKYILIGAQFGVG